MLDLVENTNAPDMPTQQPSLISKIFRRGTLPKLRRSALARTIANPIIEKMGGSGSVSYEKFLEEVYALKTPQTP